MKNPNDMRPFKLLLSWSYGGYRDQCILKVFATSIEEAMGKAQRYAKRFVGSDADYWNLCPLDNLETVTVPAYTFSY